MFLWHNVEITELSHGFCPIMPWNDDILLKSWDYSIVLTFITYIPLIPVLSVLMVTFSEGNGHAEVEEGDFKDTLACDDNAHKADVCT